MERKSGSGRPLLLNSNDISYLKKKINADPQIGSIKLDVEFKKIAKKNISSWCIRNNSCKIGLHGKIACKKPFLSKKHIMVRKQWASKHACYSDKRWNQVIFNNETKINLFDSMKEFMCEEKLVKDIIKKI